MRTSISLLSSPSYLDLVQLKAFLIELELFYPNFEQWLDTKIIGRADWKENRILMARQGNALVGVSLMKKSVKETKLRAVRVAPSLQSSGLGIRLIDQSLEVLENERPLVTVSEELLGLYSRAFVNRYGFALDEVAKGMYRPQKLEYIFNKGS